MENLFIKVKSPNQIAFTHNGKFHADDVFSSALLRYLNPNIQIIRGNIIPEKFNGIVFDIGRGTYDHHQKDSKIRDNGVPYAAFGLLWEALGINVLGEELALRFDEEFIQPLDLNDNTGEKNELAAIIGDFNPTWDSSEDNDTAFFEAVQFAQIILKNKFSKFLGNERADLKIQDYLVVMQKNKDYSKILVLNEYIPFQKKLSSTDIEFVVFPSNRGGYCILPLKKENSINYKCSFKESWLGLEKEELQKETGLKSSVFCHKGGFIMTVQNFKDAIMACKISQESSKNKTIIVNVSIRDEKYNKQKIETTNSNIDFHKLIQEEFCEQELSIIDFEITNTSEFTRIENCMKISLEKEAFIQEQKDMINKILQQKPDYVFIYGNILTTYYIVHRLLKKRVNVISAISVNEKLKIVKIPFYS